MRRSYLMLAAVCGFWGTIPVIARRVDLQPVDIVFVRVWIAAGALSAVLASGAWREPGARLFAERRARCIAAGLLLAVHWTAMFAGYQRAPDDTVIFIIFLAPVGVAALAPRVLGERIGLRSALALVLAVGGFVFVAAPSLDGAGSTGTPAHGAGIAWACLSFATFVALILASKPLAQIYGGLRLTLIEMTVAGIALVPTVMLFGSPPDLLNAGASAFGWLAVLGVMHTAIGITIYLATLARVPATHVGILGYLEPLGVVLFSWLAFSEGPRPTTVLGGALIVGAGVIVVIRSEVAERVPG